MKCMVKASNDDPAFILKKGNSVRPYTYKDWLLKLRSIIKKTGHNSMHYATHSFRRGGASFAFRSGVSPYLVKLMGDWQSDAYRRYIHVPLDYRKIAAHEIASAVQDA